MGANESALLLWLYDFSSDLPSILFIYDHLYNEVKFCDVMKVLWQSLLKQLFKIKIVMASGEMGKGIAWEEAWGDFLG